MVKQRSDEPDDKAFERLREFQEKRKAVPDRQNENDQKKKDKHSKKDQPQHGKKKDKATDKL
jgi:hypothetical protein